MKKITDFPVIRVLLLDLLLLNLINAFFVLEVKGYDYGITSTGEHYLFLLVLLNLLWVVINVLVTRYKMDIHRGIVEEVRKILFNMVLFTGTVSVIAFVFKEFRFSRIIVYGTLAAFFVGQLIFHLTLLGTIKTWRRGNRLKKTVLIVGSGETAIELTKELSASRTIDYEIVDYSGTDIGTAFDRYKIDELFIVMTSQEGENIKEMVETADYHGVRVYMVPAFYKLFKHNIRGNHLGAIPIINVNESPLDNYYNARYKQAFDILFSITVLMLIAPLLVVIGLLVKLTSRGPVFYVPRRVGVGGRVFKMYKFRTMRHGTEKQEDKPIKRNDSRVTWVGKFLRRFNLDELPQFFNVLKGDMSVVGPRPHRVYLNKVMQNSVEKYMVRHYIKPGITGWAQVNGWRGPTETEEQKTERTRHDLWYIKHWTLGVDIKIIFLTIIGRKTRKNAF